MSLWFVEKNQRVIATGGGLGLVERVARRVGQGGQGTHLVAAICTLASRCDHVRLQI